MTDSANRPPLDDWGGVRVGPGEGRDVYLDVGESYSGQTVRIPVHVRRGPEDGPVLLVTAALHGDEINGVGAVRTLIQDPELVLRRGTLVLVPVLNILGFERHSRYLPDRRDLNRCFPGSSSGSLAGRYARVIFTELVARADYAIDLHTAAVRRTNFPNVRADLAHPEVRALAEAFGAAFVVNGAGPKGALRKEAVRAGCPTILMEGGEVWKVEPAIVDVALRGIRNVLVWLEMIHGEMVRPPFQASMRKTRWIRTDHGGFLQFHVSPGDVVRQGEILATNTSLLGHEGEALEAPFDAAVLGMTTLPAASPGEPVCHLGRLEKGLLHIEQARERLPEDHPHGRALDDLSANLVVVDPEQPPPTLEP